MAPRKASRFSDERLEKLENLTQDIHAAVMGVEGKGGIYNMVTTQNGRVRKLENWRNLLTGGYIVGAAVLAYIANQFSWKVK